MTMLSWFDAFICHRRSDGQPLALAIREYLRRRGAFVFLDISQKKPGAFYARLIGAIKRARKFVVIVSQDLVVDLGKRDDWVLREISYAQESEKPIVRIDVEQSNVDGLRHDLHALDNCPSVVEYRRSRPEALFDQLIGTIGVSLFSRFRRIIVYLLCQGSVPLILCSTALIAAGLVGRLEESVGRAREEALGLRRAVESKAGEARHLEERIEEIEEGRATVIFLIDTTGSMHNKLAAVAEHATRMAKAAQGAEYMIILFGDHYDSYTVRYWRNTLDPEKVREAIIDAPRTHGGDIPEAIEDAVHLVSELLKKLPQRKTRVMIFTDAPAHLPTECPHGYDLTEELAQIAAQGVSVEVLSAD